MAEIVGVKRDPVGNVMVLDQSRLPKEEKWLSLSSAEDVADAIRRNTLLGSSAIGIAAAYGLACGARKLEDIGFEEEWNRMCANMAATRPTAPDLFRCIEAMKREVSEHRGTHPALLERLTLRADELQSARMALDSAISDMGDEFIKTGEKILLHGSTGALATGGFGMSLGAIKCAKANGKQVSVIIAEARPDMAGGRVGAYEALKSGIKTAVCCDSAVGHVLEQKMVESVIVDAIKVAGNGDVAASVGTYPIAALCRHHNIPFYVMAALNTVDVSSPSADAFMTEERSALLVREIGPGRSSMQVVHKAASLINPTFDRTPAEMITAIITEEGAVTPDEHGGFVDGLREKLQVARSKSTA